MLGMVNRNFAPASKKNQDKRFLFLPCGRRGGALGFADQAIKPSKKEINLREKAFT